jgi:AcrR family transcriptional regulator
MTAKSSSPRSAGTVAPEIESAAHVATPAQRGLKEQRRLNRVRISREQVLDVAEALFGDNGYQATSLEQVAAGSEFSVGAVYKIFASKRELLAAVLHRRHVEMRAMVLEILATKMPGLDEVLGLCAFYFGYFSQHPSFGRLTLRVYPAGLEPLADFEEYGRRGGEGTDLFMKAIQRGQREKTIRPGDARWLATLVQGMIIFDHSLRYEEDAGKISIEDLLDVVRSAVAAAPS